MTYLIQLRLLTQLQHLKECFMWNSTQEGLRHDLQWISQNRIADYAQSPLLVNTHVTKIQVDFMK